MKVGTAYSVALTGLNAFTVETQAFISPGLPKFTIIGLPDTSLNEARERVKPACRAIGFRWPDVKVTVNMSPASLPKRGSSHDLAVAVSVLAAGRAVEQESLENCILAGELNLDGSILPVSGILPILLHAKNKGIKTAYIPHANIEEAKLVPGIETIAVRHLGELVEKLGGKAEYAISESRADKLFSDYNSNAEHEDVSDMSDVIGQDYAKWALEVAAAGGHHVLMTGPPGAGKTMLSSRVPSILPPLSQSEQLEVASVRSVCGTISRYGITDIAPFEAPHHSASVASIAGGGAGIAKPGAITRAHRGVLFMDEAPEFSVSALQSLREPLETGTVTLSRSKGSVVFPAQFQLVMAANPCPCGKNWGNGTQCTCRAVERSRYWSRLSGPILDRIDIQIDVPPVSSLAVSNIPSEKSAEIRKRVIDAREAAACRFKEYGWNCNARADGSWLREHTPKDVLDIISEAVENSLLSVRGADRTMRLAWTLADLEGKNSPQVSHTDAAIMLRTRIKT